MKNNIKIKLFGWIAASTALMLTSCKDIDFVEDYPAELSDEVKVTFHLAPEAEVSSRATGYVEYPENGEPAHIGDGSKADMLIYSVYDENGELLEGYSAGTDPELKALGFDHGDGQTILKVDDGFPYTVNLILKRGEKYKIAFWAQSSKTKAYNTSDLRKVEVIYSELANESTASQSSVDDSDDKTTTPNNDEFRDAFCRTVDIESAGNQLDFNVYLYRPLAQINVGTNGFDYEIVTRDSDKKYTYSKIRLNRVARYLDVVNDQTITTTTDAEDPTNETPESFAVVDFGYAPIPAYVNYYNEDRDYTKLPTYPSYTVWDWANDDALSITDGSNTINKDNYNDYYGAEEFLKVHLEGIESDGNNEFCPYVNYNTYSQTANKDKIQSETFKYLSMCYVLTASTKEEATVINNVKVWLATDENGSDAYQILDLNQVPAQRNWRTNIIGNILTEENTFDIKLDKDFAGEYNGWFKGDEIDWSGPLADGVYYDAKADEILISNLNGLLWFQKMVNGTLKLRESPDKKATKRGLRSIWYNMSGNTINLEGADYYLYYPDTNNDNPEPIEFPYDGISEPDDETLKARILKATHQDQNESAQKKWPAMNNFHFYGKNGPAKVKLMADIDAGAVEWIPIGFEGRIIDTFNRKYEEANTTNRGFFGIFDGNGHTIYNIRTKRFSAWVYDYYDERADKYSKELKDPVNGDGCIEYKEGKKGDGNSDLIDPSKNAIRYADNPQWFGRGLFGQIGGSAKIRNVRLQNVSIKGCQGVGGIVGIAYGDDIEISNCIVDGGSIEVTPLWRADWGTDYTKVKESNSKLDNNLFVGGNDRTFARGVYLGGIVGLFQTVGGKVENCQVRGLYMKGYRRIGGLIGSLEEGNYNKKDYYPEKVTGNIISNTVLVASQLHDPFAMQFHHDDASNTNMLGFNWDGTAYDLMAREFVGGSDITSNVSGNTQINLTFAKMPTSYDTSNSPLVRESEVPSLPLEYMPPLSSWAADNIELLNNYFGSATSHRVFRTKLFEPRTYTIPGQKFRFPQNLPEGVEYRWVERSGNVGLYVESIKLNGSQSVGGRSVVTPTGITGENDCAMYITARDRKQFFNSSITFKNQKNGFSRIPADGKYKEPTVVKNMVLRGEPWAYTGILIAPNENMEYVELENIAIYDCYRTIALDELDKEYTKDNTTYWPNTIASAGIPLTIKNSNLRGYTVPGAGWQRIAYTGTTFEAGGSTGHGDLEHTYKVEDTTEGTTFKGCFFKAPYIIDLSELSDSKNISFSEDASDKKDQCFATATSNKNVQIVRKEGCTKIVIGSDVQGNPTVTYYNREEVIE